MQYDLTAMGELLIDYTYAGISENNNVLFEQNPGGAPANVACAMARLGLKTAFIGKVGKDMQGDFLKSALKCENVNIDGIISDEKHYTTMAFVSLNNLGEREFSFARKNSADIMISESEINSSIISNSFIFHFGSLSLTSEPSRNATFMAIDISRKNNGIISYDPNYRAMLWDNKKAASNEIRKPLQYVDIVKISDEETELLTDFKSPVKASYELIKKGIKIVVVTLGEKGALIRNRYGYKIIPTEKVRVIDTTGAGDAFFGGLLYQIAKNRDDISTISIEQLCEYTEFANKVASFCIQKRGAIPALPMLGQIK